MERTYSGAAAIVVVVFIACVIMLLPRGAEAEEVLASCYGSESGGMTASGDAFDPAGFTAASPYLEFGTVLLVSYGMQTVSVVINDRGPASWTGRGLDLSMGACSALGLVSAGVDVVKVE